MEQTSKDSSWREKFAFLFTKKFLFINILGQFLAFCITATIVTSIELNIRGAIFPVTQSALTYFSIFCIYTPITFYQLGANNYVQMLKERGWKYLILSIFDVEANFFVVKSFSYASPLSIALLDAWTIPVVVILTIIFLKVKYHWSQYLGVLIALAGIGLVIKGDFTTGNNGDMNAANDLVKGDLFCLIGATFYGFSNVLEEYFVRKRPFYEVVGQMGLWGTIITVIQLCVFEIQALKDTPWDGPIVGILIAFNIAMICLYTVAPFLFRLASATYFNLSLLASDFYTLIFAVCLYGKTMASLYPLAFVCTTLGLITFYIYPTEQPKISRDDDLPERHDERDLESNEIVVPEKISESNEIIVTDKK